MPDDPLPAHSLAEAYLYLMASRCPSCGRGPLKGSDARAVPEAVRAITVGVTVTCDACDAVTESIFQLSSRPKTEDLTAPAVVNPTNEPSLILDVGQWITLFRMIVEAADREADKVQARHLGLEAAQCLQEALKFYDDPDNDLPPPEALFIEASRRRFREQPQQFSKRRLIELRSKLPSVAKMRARLSAAKKKPWWRRW